MRVLFVHRNPPGQFRHLAPHLAAKPGHEIVFLGETAAPGMPGVRSAAYRAPKSAGEQTHPYVRRLEACVRRGQAAARALIDLRRGGFTPDMVIAHPGWGEVMFLREVLPRTRLLSYCEMFYRSEGQDTGFIPETLIDLDGQCRIRTWNADLLTSLSIMDHGLSPTEWQRAQHPAEFLGRISVIHEGVDTQEVAPRADSTFSVPNGPTFVCGDEVVTFVARDLEPLRGFAMLMRALPELLRRRPLAHVVICGGDGVSYGRPSPDGTTWREALERECRIDSDRVHFVGKLARPQYLVLLRVSALHLYLTVPFVLSWSCVEALASGCLVLGSDVAPVREVIEDGVTGFLVDPRDPLGLARRAAELLAARARLTQVRRAARTLAVARFDLRDALVRQTRLVEGMMS